MPSLLYESGANGLWIFMLVTVAMGGSAAFLSGQAIAQTWRPFWHIPVYMLAIAGLVRFFHFALFDEPMLALKNFLVDYVLMLAAAALGYRLVRAQQMARQYGWLFRRAGMLGWRRRA